MSTNPDQAPGPVSQPVITTGAGLVGGGVWKVISTSLPQIYVLAVSIIAARYLGAARFGRQSFIAFVEWSLISLFSGGLSIAFMRQVGEAIGRGRPGAVRSLFRWAWWIELAGAGLGGASLALTALFGAEPQAAWVLAGVVCAFSILHTIPSAVLIGLQRWREATIAGLATGAVATVATVLVLDAGGGITGMFAVEAVSSCGILIWTSSLARRALEQVGPAADPAHDLRRRMLRLATLASLSVMLELIVWRRSEFFFLAKFSADAQIAFYSVAFAVVTGLLRLPGTVVSGVLSPAIANLYGAGELVRIRRGFSRALRLVVLVTLPIVAVTCVLGPRLLAVVWGPDFTGARNAFLVLAAVSMVLPLSDLCSSLLIGLGELRVPLIVSAIAAAINVGLAFALIPPWGALGAALASSGAQLAATGPLLMYAKRTLGGLPWRPTALTRTGLVSTLSALAAWAGLHTANGGGGLVVGTFAAIAVFALLARCVRILPADDAAWLEEATSSRAGGAIGRLCRACASGG